MSTAESRIFSVAPECAQDDLSIEGTLPPWLRGTLYLNGPAGFERGGQKRDHWLDGDGLVRRLHFGDTVSFRSRYVRTRRFQEEQDDDSLIYRSFGTAFPNDQLVNKLSLASPANVSAYPFGGKLLAFGEQSLPWLLDPETLATQGEMPGVTKLNRIGALSAHAKFGPEGRMANFGIRYFGPRARLFYYEFDESLVPVCSGNVVLQGANVIHDFALSKDYAIFYLAPYALDAKKFLQQGASLLDALNWDGQKPAELVVFRRHDAALAARMDMPYNGFCLHLTNAWNDGKEIGVDLLETDVPFYEQYRANPYMFQDLHATSSVRITLAEGEDAPRQIDRTPLEMHADFPSVPNDWVCHEAKRYWALGMPATPAPAPKFYNRLFRFDQGSGSFDDAYVTQAGRILGAEPVVVLNPADSDQGVAICQESDPVSGRCWWIVLDAFALRRGVQARISLPDYDPPGFHSAWVSAD